MSAIFPELPATLGIYKLTELLVEYEHSELYLAEQSYVDRTVVLEVLRPESPPAVVEAFQEAVRRRAAARLPHTSPVLDSAQTEQLLYLIQEKPPGMVLTDYVEQAGLLNAGQAYELILAEAELYSACREQEMAARPLLPGAIYTDGAEFSFFSPVVAGSVDEEQRAEQMETLAELLEAAVDKHALEQTNVANIMIWMRQGYNGAPLQWRPLAASLAARKKKRGAALWRRMCTMWADKRLRQRVLRQGLRWGACVAGMLALVVGLGVLGAYYEPPTPPPLPVVNGKYVYCTHDQGASTRVDVRPVSVPDYAAFLRSLGQMNPKQLQALHNGVPESSHNHTPADWKAQRAAAKRQPDAPVRGVNYWDAMVYARWAGGTVPSADLLHTVRKQVPQEGVEEWTSSTEPEIYPLPSIYIVLPAEGSTPLADPHPEQRHAQRSFRVSYPL